MSHDDDKSNPSIPGIPGDGRSLRVDGRITGETPTREPPAALAPYRRPRASDEPKPLEEMNTGELELDHSVFDPDLGPRGARRPYVEPGPYRPVAPRSRVKPFLIMLGLIGLGFAALIFNRRNPDWVRRLPASPLSKPSIKTVLVMSEPSGATVKIGETVVGVTPWSGENLWQGNVPISLSLPGHQLWKGTLRGGETVEFEISLTAK